jgi:hypothetical protein
MTQAKTCPRCGAQYEPARSPHGLCQRCLIAVGMRDPDEVVVTQGAPREAAPEIAAIAPLFPELVLEELIGQGGMGFVYRARHPELDRKVALKLLARSNASDAGFVERFRREARTLARLQHPGIVTIFDSGERGGWCYLVIEFVEGANLRHLMRTAKVEPKVALSIVSQVCEALQYSHDQGIVHRDIKPENVLVDVKGRVKIADFGLARVLDRDLGAFALTGSHQVMGTPHYMAPEQWEKPASVDHRADIYALGVVFYELLTGEMPLGRFDAPSKRVQVDVRLDEIVLKSLEKQPERRYQHASEVKSDIDGVSNATAAEARLEAEQHRASRAPMAPRSRQWRVLLSVLVFITYLFTLWLIGRKHLGLEEFLLATIIGGILLAPLLIGGRSRASARPAAKGPLTNGKLFLFGLVFFVGLYMLVNALAFLTSSMLILLETGGTNSITVVGYYSLMQFGLGLPGVLAGWHVLDLSARDSSVWSKRALTGFDASLIVFALFIGYHAALNAASASLPAHQLLPHVILGATAVLCILGRRLRWLPPAGTGAQLTP